MHTPPRPTDARGARTTTTRRGAQRLRPATLMTIVLAGAMSARLASAQGVTQNLRGDHGLQAGTQAPPGWYVTNFTQMYPANQIVDRTGHSINAVSLFQTVNVTAFTYVSQKKVLGAHPGFTIGIPFSNMTIETPTAERETGFGMSDMYVRPLELGWKTPRADFTVAYGVYAPVGKFHLDATDNKGMGAWSHEPTAGATLYLDPDKRWHAATSAFYNVQSHVRGSDRKVGNVLSLEGGAGRSFHHRTNVGVAYFAQWKVTDDQNAPVPENFMAKDRYFGVGPEINTFLRAGEKTMIGLGARWLVETGSRVATQGDQVYLTVTLARIKP